MTAKSDNSCTETKITISKKVQPLHPIAQVIVDNLAGIDAIRFIRVTPSLLLASSEVHEARKMPVTKPGHPTAIGISLIIDEARAEIQFYEITSAVKGYGSKMVEAVLNALPENWKTFVVMDWSGGFWKAMQVRHRRIFLL